MKIENQEKVWNGIAIPWRTFRSRRPIAESADFLEGKKGKLLDLGCGSGRNFTKINGVIYGVDFSDKMLKFAAKYAKRLGIKVKLTKSEAWKLPFQDNFFDSAICIAVIHCIPSKENREKTLKELFRVLKPGTDALITVWNKNQDKFRKSEKEVIIPWEYNDKEYQRYYYLYDAKEFVDLLKSVGFEIKQVNDKHQNGSNSTKNINVIVRKP